MLGTEGQTAVSSALKVYDVMCFLQFFIALYYLVTLSLVRDFSVSKCYVTVSLFKLTACWIPVSIGLCTSMTQSCNVYW